jgi:hypothetical protein
VIGVTLSDWKSLISRLSTGFPCFLIFIENQENIFAKSHTTGIGSITQIFWFVGQEPIAVSAF